MDRTASPILGVDGEGLTFLLGIPRSGTTLLSVMLDRHPDVASPPEPWVMLALQALGRVSIRHPANAQVLGKAVRDFAAPARMAAAQAAAARTLYDAHLAETGKRLFVDKTPRYWLILDHLLTVFPAARFVWLVRNPLDVAASHLSTWGLDLPTMLAEGIDDSAVLDLPLGLTWLEEFHARLGDRVHRVTYEALVANPADELAAMLAHMGLPTDRAEAVSFTNLKELARDPDRFGDPKVLATLGPHDRSVDSWRTAFDRDRLRILLEAIGGERMTRLGYGSTVAALRDMGISERDPNLHLFYRAQAERRLAARLEDVDRAAIHCAPLPGAVQARVHAGLAGDAAWNALVSASAAPERAALLDKIEELSRRLAKAEASV